MSARFRFRNLPDGSCLGAIDVRMPSVPGLVTAYSIGDSKADALAKAALVAERITSDPVMSALMPPQALEAIKAAKGLAAAAARGPHVLRSLWGRIHGPGKKRLAQALHDEAVNAERESEVGILPFALLAAKYGPAAARKAYAALKRRKRKRKSMPEAPESPESDEQSDEATEAQEEPANAE
jgi:hypothetical protein